MTETIHTIGTAARLLGVSTSTLLAYERRGIIAPVRDATGRRIYDAAQIERARAYMTSRRLGRPPEARHA
jgi:DNA-binding transcriptional MerR regulator